MVNPNFMISSNLELSKLVGFFIIIGAGVALALNFVDGKGFLGAGASILWLVIAVMLVLIKGSRRQ